MTSALIREAMQEAADQKARGKIDDAYRKAMRNTEEAPAKDARDAVRGQRGYAKGGSVTRADGCITKGHTRGKMV